MFDKPYFGTNSLVLARLLLVRVDANLEAEFQEKKGLFEEACRVDVRKGWRYCSASSMPREID